MIRPIKVRALPRGRICVSFSDGVEGVIDLSPSVGHSIFTPLKDSNFFETVHIGAYGQIAWSDEIEICPDAAYLEIKQKALLEPAHA